MRIVADLHVHSKYARATSPAFDLDGLSTGAKLKGIQVISTGDFTHPAWFSELREKLRGKDEGRGLFAHNGVHFLLSGEVSCIFPIGEKTKKMHIVFLMPGLDEAAQFSERIAKFGDLKEDGRPTLLTSPGELIDCMRSSSKDALAIPAHIWTPWFSLFGSKSGVDSLNEAFGGAEQHIHALETGLSSDPGMNWEISALDKYTLVSNSDAHSQDKLGREANVLDLPEMSFAALSDAIITRKGFLETYEFYPEEGKYHYDGHRDCGVVMNPDESKKLRGICPVCKRKLTIGVLNRVRALADRKEGFVPTGAVPFRRMVPLRTVIAIALGKSEVAKQVGEEYARGIAAFGTEFNVLLAEYPALVSALGAAIADAIEKSRTGKLHWVPGHDGVFGKASLDESKIEPPKGMEGQKTLEMF